MQDNLRLLAKKDPELAHLVGSAVPNREHAHENLGTWWDSLALDRTSVLYVYGLGGDLFSHALPWLSAQTDRYLVLLEDDVGALCAFLERDDAAEAIRHPRVRFHLVTFHPDYYAGTHRLLEDLAWYYHGLEYQVAAIPPYQRSRPKASALYATAIQLINDSARMDAASYLFNFLVPFVNICANAPRTEGSRHARDLHGALRDIPAVICGAGPSLAANGSLLHALGQKAALFAGGAAISCLNAGQIYPHFGLGMDPFPARALFFPFLIFETPYFYVSQLSSEGRDLLHGPLLFAPAPGRHPIARWFEERWELSSPVDATGYTVSDFALKMALHMGCNPILFVGMDLCLTTHYYAAGSSAPSRDLASLQLVEAHDIHGNPVSTKKDWLSSSRNIAHIASLHPDRQFFNCTEGGIGFQNIPNISLREAIAAYLRTPHDIGGRIHAVLQETSSLHVPAAAVVKELRVLEESLERCSHIADELSLGYRTFTQEKAPLCAQVEAELAEEPAYRALLDEFVQATLKLSRRTIEASLQTHAPEAVHLRAKMELYAHVASLAAAHRRALTPLLAVL